MLFHPLIWILQAGQIGQQVDTHPNRARDQTLTNSVETQTFRVFQDITLLC